MLFVLLTTGVVSGATITSVGGSNLNWNTPSTWIGGIIPATNDDVVIPGGSFVVINNYYTPTIRDLTVTGKIDITNTSTSTLSMSGNLTVNGILNNQGGIEITSNNKAFTLGAGASYVHNPRNNTLLDESIFIKMIETFDPASNLSVSKWFDLTIPLGSPSRVTSTYFGFVTLSVPTPGTRWNQSGQFMDLVGGTQRVKGTLTIQDGIVVMDDGTGNSNSLILSDVIVSNTGSIIFQSGQNRPLTLFTGNFTDVSSSASPSVVMDSCFSLVIWTVNGSVILSHNFNVIRGSGNELGGDARVTINGDLTINGGNVSFIKMAYAPLDLNVIGKTQISGNPTSVNFSDGNGGSVVFKTNNFIIQGGLNNVLVGGNAAIRKPTGPMSFTVNNDFLVNGASTTTLVSSDTTASQKISLKVGRDMIISGSFNANLTVANTRAAYTVNVGRNLSLTAGKFVGQANTNGTNTDSVIVGLDYLFSSPYGVDYFKCNYGKGNTVFKTTGNFTMASSGTALGQGFEGITNGSGDMTFLIGGAFTVSSSRFAGIYNSSAAVTTGSLNFTVTGAFTQNSGFFRGIDNRVKSNLGSITFNSNSFAFNGGNFNAFQTVNYAASNGFFNITNNLNISYSATSDSVLFIGYSVIFPDNNAQVLNLNVGGSMTITGVNGTFISSIGNAPEVISINGNVAFMNGRNSFNSYPNSVLANAHKVNMTIGGSLNNTGGTSYLSAFNDSLVATINGDVTISGGILTIQGGNTYAKLDVKGGYNQSGGTFYLHNNTTNVSFNSIEVTINSDTDASGNFTHSGGTINFDNNNSGPAFTMTIRSPNVSLSGSGSITRALPGTNTTWGNLVYNYPGTVSFTRSGLHNIQQVRQKIDGTTYFNIVSGTLQVASYKSGPVFDMLNVALNATLDMHGFQVKSNVQQPWSGISIAGRIKTTHPNGLYNGTVNATIDFSGQMYFWLQTNSTVEYNGTDNQVVSGVNVGTATLSISRYYNLDINFQGTPDVEFVYPTNVPDLNSVIVRNKLFLTEGELNLDNDHNNLSGGRTVILTKGNYDAIIRTNGYIRSEVVDGSGQFKWVMGGTPGVHTIPFGYASGAANLIPFSVEKASTGSIDTLVAATYHTAVNNQLYPPGILHVNGLSGADNSANTVDRFWYVRAGGSATSINMTFVATAAEVGSIPNPRAQRWLPSPPPLVGGGWELPYQGTQSTITNGTQVNGATGYTDFWWTLAGLATPLPVELTSFTGQCRDRSAVLQWTTQSEVNNSHFTVLRSDDGEHFTETGVVSGAGTVSTPQSYAFTDSRPLVADITYYALEQSDYDGLTKRYGPIAVQSCNGKDASELRAFSNGHSALNIIMNAATSGNYVFELYDLAGQLLLSSSRQITEGANAFTLPHDRLAEGIYLLRATGESDAFTRKVMIRNTP